MTALHYAFEGGFHKVINAGNQIVEAFLRRSGRVFEELRMRVCISAADKRGRTVLHVASEEANSHICKRLLDSGASVTAKDTRGQTALHCAFNGEIDRVIDIGIPIAKALLSRFDGHESDQSVSEFVNAADERGRTALHRASEKGNANICRLLVGRGALVTATDINSMTVLHYAFEGGIDKDVDVVSDIAEALVGKCNEQSIRDFVNASDVNGRTALHSASKKGNAKICVVLLERGASVTVRDRKGKTALHYACEKEIAETLLRKCNEESKNEFVNATDDEGMTALHRASHRRDTHICELLVDASASLATQDKMGMTALHYAFEVRTDKDIDMGTEVAQALLRLCDGRDTYEFVNAADERGRTALHNASEKGITDLCRVLIDRGASA